VVREAACLNSQPFVVQESYHQGDTCGGQFARMCCACQNKSPASQCKYCSTGMPAEFSAVQINEPNVLATAYKLCEDGSGDVILRCYETQGKAFTRAAIFVPQMDAEFWADFTRHEVKTLRINQDGRVLVVNFLEGITL